ncbi:MAG: DedA family protein [Mycobacteriales bacterium]
MLQLAVSFHDFIDPKAALETFGMIGVFCILFAETGLLVGFFLPGDTLLLSAGFFAWQGKLPLAALAVICPVAAIIGAQTGHYIGVKGGARLFGRPNAKLFRREHMDRAEKYFNKFGPARAVVLARFIPVVRTFLNPVAGMLEMPARRFFVFNAIGGLLWTWSILATGWLAGHYLGKEIPIDKYVLPIIALIIVVSFAGMFLEYYRGHRALKRERAGENIEA